MFEHEITSENVCHALATGKTIETYPDDQPYPSRLVLGWNGSRPIHVVAADNSVQREPIIITVYEPEPAQWEPGFERRRHR